MRSSRLLAIGLFSISVTTTSCDVELNAVDPFEGARTAEITIEARPVNEQEEASRAIEFARQQMLSLQLDANERARQSTAAADFQARVQQMNEAQRSRQTSNSTNPAFSEARSTVDVTKGAVAGFLDISGPVESFISTAVSNQRVDPNGLEQGLLLTSVPDGVDTNNFPNRFDAGLLEIDRSVGVVKFFAGTVVLEGIDDFLSEPNIVFHTHPIGVFLNGNSIFNLPRFSSFDVDVFLELDIGLTFVAAQTGEYTALSKPAGWTFQARPARLDPDSFALDAIRAANFERRTEILLELTQGRVSSLGDFLLNEVPRIVEADQILQDFLASRGVTTLRGLQAERTRRINDFFRGNPNGETFTGLFADIDEDNDQVDAALIRAGFPSTRELTTPLTTEEQARVAADASLTVLLEIANELGLILFSGTVGDTQLRFVE